MDIQGYECHGVYKCHRCGWPFSNSHPSSKHRRAHKKICGTIEGYTKLIDTLAVSDDEDDDEHQFVNDDDNEKTPSPKIRRMNGNSSSGIKERSNKSEDALFSDAVTEFSDAGISPVADRRFLGTTKLLDSPLDTMEVDTNSELFETPDGTHLKDEDKTEENDVNIVEPFNTVGTKLDSDHTDQGEEDVYVLSVSSDIPLVDDAETLLNDFKDHKTVYSIVPHGEQDVEKVSKVDSFEIKSSEAKIEESQTSENAESSMKSAVAENSNLKDLSDIVPTVVTEDAKVAETQPREMIKTDLKSTDKVTEVVSDNKRMDTDSDHEQVQEVIKKAEIDDSVLVLDEFHSQENVKEHENVDEVKQNIVDSLVGDDRKDSDKIGNLKSSENVVLEKAEESCDASGVVSESVVDEGDGKLLTSQRFGVDASIDSGSRNSLEGNWGSVSGTIYISLVLLSTASVDAENAHSSVKSETLADKSRLGKQDVSESSVLVKPKEDIVDHETSETKAVVVLNSQPSKSEEAIAKVTNWSTGEAKSSNPAILSTMIQKDEAAEKASELEKSTLVNRESSPPKYISDDKKIRKKSKGRPSWLPFVCCSSVNVN
ncbi:uncharacterized protein [Rutidosis leptorrhynchoides]|uniref:uncharacterized protein n=1 Tax=Rutidosis leptorrhynchoides TaxID=125765 RepID=UPI003A992DE5